MKNLIKKLILPLLTMGMMLGLAQTAYAANTAIYAGEGGKTTVRYLSSKDNAFPSTQTWDGSSGARNGTLSIYNPPISSSIGNLSAVKVSVEASPGWEVASIQYVLEPNKTIIENVSGTSANIELPKQYGIKQIKTTFQRAKNNNLDVKVLKMPNTTTYMHVYQSSDNKYLCQVVDELIPEWSGPVEGAALVDLACIKSKNQTNTYNYGLIYVTSQGKKTLALCGELSGEAVNDGNWMYYCPRLTLNLSGDTKVEGKVRNLRKLSVTLEGEEDGGYVRQLVMSGVKDQAENENIMKDGMLPGDRADYDRIDTIRSARVVVYPGYKVSVYDGNTLLTEQQRNFNLESVLGEMALTKDTSLRFVYSQVNKGYPLTIEMEDGDGQTAGIMEEYMTVYAEGMGDHNSEKVRDYEEIYPGDSFKWENVLSLDKMDFVIVDSAYDMEIYLTDDSSKDVLIASIKGDSGEETFSLGELRGETRLLVKMVRPRLSVALEGAAYGPAWMECDSSNVGNSFSMVMNTEKDRGKDILLNYTLDPDQANPQRKYSHYLKKIILETEDLNGKGHKMEMAVTDRSAFSGRLNLSKAVLELYEKQAQEVDASRDVKITLRPVYEETARLNASSAGGGSVEVPENYAIPGQNIKMECRPDQGYHVARIRVNGVTITTDAEGKEIKEGGTYAIKTDTGRVENQVEAVFEKDQYIIRSSAENGEVSEKEAAVAYGSDKTITFWSDKSYGLSALYIDGKQEQAVLRSDGTYCYTFRKIDASHTLEAKFEKKTCMVYLEEDLVCMAPKKTEYTTVYGEDFKLHLQADEATGQYIEEVHINGKAVLLNQNLKEYDLVIANVTGDQKVQVVYGRKQGMMNITEEMDGQIIRKETSKVYYGFTYRRDFKAPEGYGISDVYVGSNGYHPAKLLDQYRLEIPNIAGDQEIRIVYSKKVLKIEAEVVNGTLEGAKGQMVLEYKRGENVALLFKADNGYGLSAVYVDGSALDIRGQERDTSFKRHFVSIAKDHSIKVVFEKTSFEIDASVENGYLEQPGTTQMTYAAGYGQDKTVKFYPNEGYGLESIEIDGVSEPISGFKDVVEYTFEDIKASHSIRVVYKKKKLTVRAEVVNGKIVGQTGTTAEYTAEYGDSVNVAFTTDLGNALMRVTVDGRVLIGDGIHVVNMNGYGYMFDQVKENHTIKAEFAKNIHVNLSAEGSGAVNMNEHSVRKGTEQFDMLADLSDMLNLEITPDMIEEGHDAGFTVQLDGKPLSCDAQGKAFAGAGTYKIKPSGNSADLKIVFEDIFKVTVHAENGYLNAKKWLKELELKSVGGKSVAFGFEPDEGYEFAKMLIDGQEVTPRTNNVHVVQNITKDMEIEVIFERKEHTITVHVVNGQAGKNEYKVKHGEDQDVTFWTKPGYKLDQILVDGQEIEAGGYHYKFTDVQEDHELEIIYVEDPDYSGGNSGDGEGGEGEEGVLGTWLDFRF